MRFHLKGLLLHVKGLRLAAAFRTQLEQPLNHTVVQHIVVPKSKESRSATQKHATHSTNIGKVVQKCVPAARDYKRVQIHVDANFHLCVVL